MGASATGHFTWEGLTSRADYRRWLPLIVVAETAMLLAIAIKGTRGSVNLGDFGWQGLAVFALLIPYFFWWLFFTARRLRSAGITRSWLLLAIFTINIPLGVFHLNVSLLASLVLTAVAAMARDRGEVPTS